MTFMTKKSEALLERLVRLAGDSEVVERAMRELNSEMSDAPTVPQLLDRIVKIRKDGSARPLRSTPRNLSTTGR